MIPKAIGQNRFASIIVLLLVATLLGCQQQATNEVPVCVVGDFSGPLASYGNDTRQGAAIAAEEINEAGGVNGSEIVIREFDDKTDPVEAVNIAEQAADECVAAIVGSGSGPALAAAPVYNDSGIPFVITVSSNPEVTSSGWEYVNRIQLSDRDQIERLVAYSAENLGISKLALLHDTSDFGIGGRDAMVEVVEMHDDVELVAVEAWNQTDVDFSSQILNAEDSGADAIYIVGAAEGAARIVQQAESLGVDLQFLSNTGVGNQQFLDLAGDAAEGLIIAWGAVDPSKEIVAEIDRKMQEKYDRTIDVFVAHAYDAMYALSDAMEEAGTTMDDREAIQQALRSGTYDYALGEVSFDETGHNIRHIFIAEVQNGEFHIID